MTETWLTIVSVIGILLMCLMVILLVGRIIKIKNEFKHISYSALLKAEDFENEDIKKLIVRLEEEQKQLFESAISIAKKHGHRKVTSEDVKEAFDEI